MRGAFLGKELLPHALLALGPDTLKVPRESLFPKNVKAESDLMLLGLQTLSALAGGGLVDWCVIPYTEKLRVQFPVRAHA